MLAEKRERLRSSSSFLRRHLWSTCRQQLQESFFLPANVAHGSCDVDSQKSDVIETYFLAEFENETIVSFLEKFHSVIHISGEDDDLSMISPIAKLMSLVLLRAALSTVPLCWEIYPKMF